MTYSGFVMTANLDGFWEMLGGLLLVMVLTALIASALNTEVKAKVDSDSAS